MEFDIKEIYEKILEENGSAIYLADIETYELIYLNRSTLRLFKRPLDDTSYIGKKCYEVLQGYSSPCDFCNNEQLSCAQFTCWEHYNPMVNCYFSIRDKKVMLEGRAVRMEIADDISQIVLEKQQLQNDLSAEKALVLCIQNLTTAESDDRSIHDLLEKICDLYEGERGYIFEINYENNTFFNTYEWCKDGITSEIDNLQRLPLQVANPWLDKFKGTGEIRIKNLQEEEQPGTPIYQILDPQGIVSLVAVPLLKEKHIIGFIGVDNPKNPPDDLSMMKTIAQFVSNDIEKRQILKELEKKSNLDFLSKVFNRNRYITDMKKLSGEITMPIGVVFLDLDNLKKINDSYGHSYGDELIKKTAAVLSAVFPDEIYRIGGDEFVVLAKGLSLAEFEERVNELRKQFQANTILISIGTKWILGGKDLKEAVLQADALMYREKANNKYKENHRKRFKNLHL